MLFSLFSFVSCDAEIEDNSTVSINTSRKHLITVYFKVLDLNLSSTTNKPNTIANKTDHRKPVNINKVKKLNYNDKIMFVGQ